MIHIYNTPSLLGLQTKELKPTVTHISLASSVYKTIPASWVDSVNMDDHKIKCPKAHSIKDSTVVSRI